MGRGGSGKEKLAKRFTCQGGWEGFRVAGGGTSESTGGWEAVMGISVPIPPQSLLLGEGQRHPLLSIPPMPSCVGSSQEYAVLRPLLLDPWDGSPRLCPTPHLASGFENGVGAEVEGKREAVTCHPP